MPVNFMFFQPRIDMETLKPAGMEALVRWIKPDGTIIPPGDFIPMAEESGLIIPIGAQIFSAALRQAKQIRNSTGMDLHVSVNVSARQFEDAGFDAMVVETLRKEDFSGEELEIEITESLLVKDIKSAAKKLDILSDYGVTTAIDDFGTGYSSLAYLNRLPITILKIDKSFIDDLPRDKDALVLVETIVMMARNLHLGVVAEGVETPEQLKTLSRFSPMEIQGYLFAPPMPADRLVEWINEN